MSADACGLCNQVHASEDPALIAKANSSLPHFQQYSWGITTTPVLRSVSIGFNEDISLFICLSCESAYTTGNIFSHIRSHDAGRLTPDVHQEILKIGDGANLEAAYPSWAYEAEEASTTPRPQIAGIALKQNLEGCPKCAHTGRRNKVIQHMKDKNHGGTPLVGLFAQVLNSGVTKANIRVTPRPLVEETSDLPRPKILAEFKEFDWQAHRNPELPNARMVSAWLMRTRWHEQVLPYRPHLAELLQLVAMPDPTEQFLRRLHKSVTQYFQHATEMLDCTSELVLQMLNSRNPDKDGINNTPLHAHHQKDKTQKTYVNVITHFMAALLRPSTRYTFPTSPDLTNALAAFAAVEENADNQPALHSVLMALWKTEWPSDREQHFPDPTMSFLMLFSLKEGGEFAEAKDTTGPITKLCWAIQMAMVQEIHRLVDSAEAPSQMAAWNIVAAFVVEKQMTTFNSLMSLQHYASALAYQTMAFPRIWWVDRENWKVMLFNGERITLNQLGEIFDALEKKIISLWKKDIMQGLGLHVKYADLADNLRQTRTGYSFLDDPSNPFSALQQALADGIFKAPKILAKFVTKHANGREAINVVFCRQWLMKLAELEGLIMLAIEMTSGAPARGTELAAMLARNTETRSRNLRALGHYLAIVRQYDKTTNNSQSDRLIPHALSAVNADILIQLHTYARPWARFLAKIVFPTNPRVIAQYGDLLFMDFGREFTSDKLSDLMAEWSGKTLSWKMKLSNFRDINIAWRRKLCTGPSSIEAIEEDATSTVNALQAGHTRPTEQRLYGLSPDALLGAAEDVLFLYLKASTQWQKATRVVPGGLSLPYEDATRDKFDSLVVQGIIKMNDSVSVPGGSVSNAPIDATFQQRFIDFQRESTKADAIIVAKQDDILQAITALRAEVDSLRRERQGGAPGDNTAQAPPLRPLNLSLEPEQPPVEFNLPLESEQPPAAFDTSSPTIYGAEADWRDPQQYHAVKAVLQLSNDIIVAMKTGAGKSAVAILPSMVEDGYTVIVVPLLALMDDWIRRLDKMNVGYERWLGARGPDTLSGQHNLILVSSDMARKPRWREAIAQLHSGRRPVLRYVVDEVGSYTTDYVLRGDAFLNPFQLRQFPCQVVLMSATIPPAAEAYLKAQFELADPIRFSTTSVRRELYIHIEPPCRDFEDQVQNAQEIIEANMAHRLWKPHSRFIVFVLSHKDGQAAAKTLNLPFYHAHSKNIRSLMKQGKRFIMTC
ncbi:hypothetical protein B0H13DRAFT_2328625 [Mycena leptocephala]|nr:hypothetical protein B0H13DRAFT_2328625 [Mycena leptocephala]